MMPRDLASLMGAAECGTVYLLHKVGNAMRTRRCCRSRSWLCLCVLGTRPVGTVGQAGVVSIRLRIEKPGVHERGERHLAHRSLDAAQALHLRGLQAQPWHFPELGAETVEHVFNRSHDP